MHCLIQRGILSPSSSNNQLVMSFNKCIYWLVCNSIQREISSPSSPQQSTSNVNQQMHWLTTSWLNIKRNPSSFLSWQSTGSINQHLHWWTTLQLDPKGILSPSSPNNQLIMSINDASIEHFVPWSKGESFLLPLPIINQFYQSMIVSIDYFSTWYEEESFLLSLATINQNKINQPLHQLTTLLLNLSTICFN